jgi:hypothetical protein
MNASLLIQKLAAKTTLMAIQKSAPKNFADAD